MGYQTLTGNVLWSHFDEVPEEAIASTVIESGPAGPLWVPTAWKGARQNFLG